MSRHCAIVLHAHVPWVRHPEVSQSLEEDWLHTAVLETYLPLLDSLHRLRDENVPFRITLDLSPTLIVMLQDRLMKRRTLAYLDRTLTLCRDEIERGHLTGFTSLAKRYLERYEDLRIFFMDRWQGDLVRAFSDLRDSGHLEITASAATHGLLPLLMRVPEAVQAQVGLGIRQYVNTFGGTMPHGFWLPECAYAPALSRVLNDSDILWTLVEEHGATHAPGANPKFPNIVGRTQEGLIVFARDQQASSQVWNADEGYPGDDRYRDFMRDIGLEAPIEFLREYLGENEERQFTGLKYFRSSRSGGESELYDWELAAKAVDEHSTHFVNSRGAQLAALESEGIADPISVCAFDADLFGHWWFEGIDFLEAVFRKAQNRSDFQFSTLSEYAASGVDMPEVAPTSSSWGEGGYFETWTSEENNWMQDETVKRSSQLAHLVRIVTENKDEMREDALAHRKRCLRQMTRELLLAQSSDWGFLMRNESSRDYAERRVREHLSHFDEIWKFSNTLTGDERLKELEDATPIFEDVPWNIFEPYH